MAEYKRRVMNNHIHVVRGIYYATNPSKYEKNHSTDKASKDRISIWEVYPPSEKTASAIALSRVLLNEAERLKAVKKLGKVTKNVRKV